MTLYTSLTGAIDKGPAGPRIGAFFDLDRTLIAGFSASARHCAFYPMSGSTIGTLEAELAGQPCSGLREDPDAVAANRVVGIRTIPVFFGVSA